MNLPFACYERPAQQNHDIHCTIISERRDGLYLITTMHNKAFLVSAGGSNTHGTSFVPLLVLLRHSTLFYYGIKGMVARMDGASKQQYSGGFCERHDL